MYFKGFNALRFFAAYAVVVCHLELIRVKYHFYNFANLPFSHLGGQAVTFFFVLSGFLITYLLLEESNKSGTVNIKSFYMRRVYRIWPLYYILVILGLFLIPAVVRFLQIDYDPLPVWPTLGLFVFMVPNLVTPMFGSNFLTPLWSIGVEEQFYLFWAPMVKWFKKYFVFLAVTIIVIRLIFYWYAANWTPFTEGERWLKEFLQSLRFECMAVGGMGAYYLFHNKEKMAHSFLFNPWVQIGAWAIVGIGLFQYLPVIISPILSSIFQSLLFLLILLNVGVNTRSVLRLDHPVLNFLGKISYGIYMYHSIVIFAIISLGNSFFAELSPFWNTVTLYLICSLATILISWLSFRFIEEPIINLKHKLK